ncbi:MAG TPA: adenosylcobinamide-GDP ribazoletransferase [Gemmatimonadaceae bacterium]|nr:adenosylcobinamide-GDP ribazoletransferase [Gemmatimonadaceae bacterium]
MPFPGPLDPTDFGAATVYFPLIGALVGGVGAGVFWLVSIFWPTPVALVLSLTATVLVTGALHEDALADAADGFGGGSTPERVLEIMKDSRVGSYGVVALILAILLKLASLASLTRGDVVVALIAAHTLARWSSVWLLGRYEYVGTKGAAFAGSVTTLRLVLATVLALGICALALQRRAFIPVLIALGVTTVTGAYFRRRLGGVTGDCLGAANQLVELAVYLTLAAAV